jgi:hypothetical protein
MHLAAAQRAIDGYSFISKRYFLFALLSKAQIDTSASKSL